VLLVLQALASDFFFYFCASQPGSRDLVLIASVLFLLGMVLLAFVNDDLIEWQHCCPHRPCNDLRCGFVDAEFKVFHLLQSFLQWNSTLKCH